MTPSRMKCSSAKRAAALSATAAVWVSSRKTSADAVATTGLYGFNPKNAPAWTTQVTAISGQIAALRMLGAGALDLCYIAAGRSEIFWEGLLKPWDFAAGRLFVTEAGGEVSRVDGNKLTQETGSILATNGLLHGFALKTLNGVVTAAKKAAG